MQSYTIYGQERDKKGKYELFIILFMFLSSFFKFLGVEYVISKGFITSQPELISVAGSMGVLLILYSVIPLLYRKIRGAALFVLNFLLTALAYTDVLYMRFYSDLFTFRNLGLSSQVGEIKESVFELLRPGDIFYFTDLFIFILIILLLKKKDKLPVFSKLTLKRTAAVICCVIAGASLYFLRISTYNKKVPGVLKAMWDKPAVCNNIGALNYHMTDFLNVVNDILSRGEITENDKEEISSWFRERNKKAPQSSLSGSAKGKNLIILQIESLQGFVIGLKSDGVEITPNLNRFAEKVHYFDRAYNQTAAGNSSDAEFLVNTALYPASSGVAYTRFAGNDYKALPSLLAARGYSTLAMHADRAGFWNRNNIYPSLGFKKFVHKRNYEIDEVIGLGLSDESFFRQSLEILKKEKQPFYAFVITLSSHYPFNFPALLAASDLDTPSLTDNLTDNYLKSIRYLDNQFGYFIKELDKAGLLDNSVLVVYGDHTALPRGEAPRLEKLLGKKLSTDDEWRDVLKIPLMIRLPGQKKGVRHEAAAGQIDVARTVCDLLGVDFRYGFGRSLFSEPERPVVFRNGTYVDGFSYITPSLEKMYDFRTGKEKISGEIREKSEKVQQELSISDKITEYNLGEKIDY